MRLSAVLGRPHGRALAERLIPLAQACLRREVRELTESDPVQRGRQGDVADGDRAIEVNVLFDEAIRLLEFVGLALTTVRLWVGFRFFCWDRK